MTVSAKVKTVFLLVCHPVQVFNANKDRDTIVNHVLIQPIIARSVQINPKSWNGHISMRAEFYGCILSGNV